MYFKACRKVFSIIGPLKMILKGAKFEALFESHLGLTAFPEVSLMSFLKASFGDILKSQDTFSNGLMSTQLPQLFFF